MKAETQMTPEAARSFDTYSAANAIAVKACFPCGCEPYKDVFTFNRWKAQGYFVRRGEHGIHLALVKAIDRENPETGEMETRRLLGSSVVFCRHQVEARS